MSEMNRESLYSAAGEALHMGQVLELNISALIELLNRGYNANIAAESIILGEDKRTLGQLVVELKKRCSVSPEGVEALRTSLKARNYIAHELFIRVTDAFRDEGAHVDALELVKVKTREIAVGTAITQGFVSGLCQALDMKLSDLRIRQEI